MCTTGLFFDGSVCATCPGKETAGYLADISDDGVCTCDQKSRYKWNSNIFECSCVQGFFATFERSCKLCPVGPGYITDPLPDGKCACDESKNYAWDPVTASCICKPNYFFSASKTCSLCPNSSALGYGVSTEASNQCLCLEEKRFFWDSATKTCKCRAGFTASNGTCYCSNGLYQNELGDCIACAGLVGLASPVSSQLSQCKCDAGKKFVWKNESMKCVCNSTLYLAANNSCAACAGMVGGAASGNASNGECLCNTTRFFEWSTSSRSCVCKAGYYKSGTTCVSCGGIRTGECLCTAAKREQSFNGSCICANGYYRKAGNCSPCSELSGIAGDASSTNLGCNCDVSLNYAWNSSTLSCSCKSGFIVDLTGLCQSCASIPGATNSSSSSTVCNCKTNFRWDSATQTCICIANYYLTAA